MKPLFLYLSYYLLWLIKLAIIFTIIKFVFRARFRNILSHWNTLIDDFSYSSRAFYDAVAEKLKETKIDDIEVTSVYLKEKGIFSRKRMYLRVSWNNYDYDICCAPFGKGFFISWWLRGKLALGEMFLAKIPFIGKSLVNLFYPQTYYTSDSASMFMTYAQSVIQQVITDITDGKGTKPLTEVDKKPLLNNIFRR